MSKDLLTTVAAGQMTDPQFSPSGESQPLASSPGVPSPDFTKGTNDLSKDAKFTLGAYLSVKTAKNEYPITFPVAGSAGLDVQSRGPGASLLQADKNGQKAFIDNSKKSEALSNTVSGLKIDNLLSKNASNELKSGNTLLSDIPFETVNPVGKQSPASTAPTGNSKGEELLRVIHEQLVDGNMFSPDASVSEKQPFLKNPGGRNEEEITRGLFSIQRNLGNFDVNGERVSVSEMSSMALAMIFRSLDNDNAANAALAGFFGNVSESALSIALRPAQFGATGAGIDKYRLSSLRALNDTPIPFVSDVGGQAGADRAFSVSQKAASAKKAASATGQDDFIISLDSSKNLLTQGAPPNNEGMPRLQSSSRNSVSRAQMNTFLEPFSVGSRFSSVSMFTMATASTLIMVGVGLAINALAGIAKSDSQPNGNIKNPSSLAMGRHKPEGPFASALTKLFQVTRTDYDFGNCVGTGIAAIYGLTPTSASTLSLISSPSSALVIAENLVLAGGFYANFTRRMISSAVSVANTFSKVKGNITQGIEALLGGIEDLLDSPVYKFIMVAAGVGDAVLKSENGLLYVLEDDTYFKGSGDDAAKAKASPYELAKSSNRAELGENRRRLTRWGDGTGTNSLSLKTFLAKQLQLPSGISANVGVSNRFTDGTVEEIENALEAEYMPFYIHDLRTQEVMSYPAFITEFGESFNANYNSVDGVGRQDPVRLYQKTERTVNFGFMLVAYNQEDHDHLWLAVNKLIAMCYPQYSAGRIRQTDSTQFIQPFSQVQAASPMVRLRLGDVFKSNYSRFGLARLFGAEEKNDKKRKLNTIEKSVFDKAYEDFRKATSKPSTDGFKVNGMRVEIKTAVELRTITGELVRSNSALTSLGTPLVLKAQSIVQIVTVDKKGDATIIIIDDKTDASTISTVGNFLVPLSAMSGPTVEYINALQNTNPDIVALRSELTNLQTNVPDTSFFDPDSRKTGGGNAIVRSFESTKGRGVAGFITSLGLDYGMGQYPWSIEMGSKAPMVVKISLGFAPITDLPLGLDYYGNIRNPSHPVGNFAGSFGDPHYSLSSEGDTAVVAANREYVNNEINVKNGKTPAI